MIARNIGAMIAIVASIFFIYEKRKQVMKFLINRKFLWKILVSIAMQIPAIRTRIISPQMFQQQ